MYPIICLLLFMFVSADALNGCGGDMLLSYRIGEFCDTRQLPACPFGTVQCDGPNNVICEANCSITAQLVIDAVAKKHKCLNGGYYEDARDRACTCPYGYFGDACEHHDPCINVECGTGECNKGKCICDFYYTGSSCQIRVDCQPPRYSWTGTQCKCRHGFDGEKCDRCISGLVCVPTRSGGFEAVVVDEDRIEELLQSPVLEGYSATPYVPVAHPPQFCQCSKSLDPLKESISDWDDSGSHAPYFLDLYRHHKYDHSFTKANIVYMCILAAILLFSCSVYNLCYRTTSNFQPHRKSHRNSKR